MYRSPLERQRYDADAAEEVESVRLAGTAQQARYAEKKAKQNGEEKWSKAERDWTRAQKNDYETAREIQVEQNHNTAKSMQGDEEQRQRYRVYRSTTQRQKYVMGKGPPRWLSPPPPRANFRSPDRHYPLRGTHSRHILVEKLLQLFYQNGRGRWVIRRNERRNRLIRNLQVKNADLERYGYDWRKLQSNWESSPGPGDFNCCKSCDCNSGPPRTGYHSGNGHMISSDWRDKRHAHYGRDHHGKRLYHDSGRGGRDGGGSGANGSAYSSGGSGGDDGGYSGGEREGRGRSKIRYKDRRGLPLSHFPSRHHLSRWNGKPGGVWFFLVDDGRICTTHHPSEYQRDKLNVYLRDLLRDQYSQIQKERGWRWFREIAFAYIHLWECIDSNKDLWELTDSSPIIDESKSCISNKPLTSYFRYLMRKPPQDKRWTNLVDNELDEGWEGGGDYVVTVEIIEGLNTRCIYISMFVCVLASAIFGIVFGVIRKAVGDAFSIASYIVTAVAFVVAVVAAGEWFGLESPDSFSQTGVSEHERLVGAVLLDPEPPEVV